MAARRPARRQMAGAAILGRDVGDGVGGCRDECRRRMVQGEFEVGSGGPGGGGGGVQGHGGGGQGGGQAAKLPGGGHGASSPDSPVSDVNSILAGAHLQVGTGLFSIH